MKEIFIFLRGACFLALAVTLLTACGAGSKTGTKSSADSSRLARSENFDEESPKGKKIAYQPKTGRMDGVEFYINQELMQTGLDSEKREFAELKSVFDTHLKPWQPQKGFNIPVVRNQQVDKWIAFFTGNIRSNFERWIRRGSHYVPLMEPILKEYNVPTDLIYLSMIESGFNTHAYSHAHAAGLWQFIPGTGRMYGLESGSVIDERRDIIKSTRAAAAHLRDLYNMYGDWYLAWAAYNAGPGTVNRALKSGGSRNFWSLADSRKRLFRQETKDYVPRILAAAIIMKNYKKYGFSSTLFERPLNVEQVEVPDATDLAILASCAGLSVDEMKYYNPSLVGGMTPPGRSYIVYVPGGLSNEFKRNYAKISPSERVRFVMHKVRKKETLVSIAKKYKIPAAAIAQANSLGPKLAPAVGTVLRIPKAGIAQAFVPQAKEAAQFAMSLPVALTAPDKKTAPLEKTPQPSQESTVDSIVSAALEEDSSDEASPIVVGEGEAPGIPEFKPQVSETPTERAGQQQVAIKQPAKTYKIKTGDTLAAIAKKNGLTLAQIRQLNGLKTNTLKVGQTIKVSSPKTIFVAKKEPAPVVTPPSQPALTSASLPGGSQQATVAQADFDTEAKPLEATPSPLTEAPVIAPMPPVSEVALPVAVLPPKASAKPQVKTHKVKVGDTLAQISSHYGMTVSQLMKANGLKSAALKPGQVLTIKSTLAKAPSVTSPTSPKAGLSPSAKERLIMHAVRKGETLWTLSRKYGVSVAQIKNWNRMSESQLQPNQKIKIYVSPTRG